MKSGHVVFDVEAARHNISMCISITTCPHVN